VKGFPTGSLIHHRSLLFEDISKAAEDDTSKAESADKDTEEESQKRTAATKIQAAFRGHHARKSLRVPEASSARTGISEEATSEEATGEQLQKEFPDDNQGKLRDELGLRQLTSPINRSINPCAASDRAPRRSDEDTGDFPGPHVEKGASRHHRRQVGDGHG